MATPKDSLIDLERRRMQLEKSVADLQKSLQHWQTWEAEYEGLKEEISGLGKTPSDAKLESLGNNFGGVLLNDEEIKLLFDDGKGQQRSAGQILGLLSRRIDYVQENVKLSRKHLLAAERKLVGVDVVIQPEARDEDDLPLTEITEELDEDGNVISSSTLTPAEVASRVIHTLRKAGVQELPEPKHEPVTANVPKENVPLIGTPMLYSQSKQLSKDVIRSDEIVPAENRVQGSQTSQDQEVPLTREKKSVSFSEDTKKSDSTSSRNSIFSKQSSSMRPNNTPNNAHPDNKSKTIASYKHEAGSPLVDESPEDTALRREMLRYRMNEVGAVVAEMELEESDGSTDYSEDLDDDQGSNTDDEEDNFGRTKRRVVDDDYRKQMLELERKLNAKMLQNIGPNPDSRASVFSEQTESEAADDKTAHDGKLKEAQVVKRKDVRFAEELDISEAPKQDSPSGKSLTAAGTITRPVSESIVERKQSESQETDTATTRPWKISKFRGLPNTATTIKGNVRQEATLQSSRIANGPLAYGGSTLSLTPAKQSKPCAIPLSLADVGEARTRTVPEGPPGKTHTPVLVERPVLQMDTEATEPDEFDPALMQQEIAVEYHHMRNRMIQRNGGFMQEVEEPETVSLSNDGDSVEGKRVSKFKAARLAKMKG